MCEGATILSLSLSPKSITIFWGEDLKMIKRKEKKKILQPISKITLKIFLILGYLHNTWVENLLNLFPLSNNNGLLLGMEIKSSIQNHKFRCEFIQNSILICKKNGQIKTMKDTSKIPREAFLKIKTQNLALSVYTLLSSVLLCSPHPASLNLRPSLFLEIPIPLKHPSTWYN